MLEITLTARQPLALGVGESAGNLIRTHRHVPGSVLRGALASAWITEHGEPATDRGLRRRFLDTFERRVRFSPLFAAGSSVVPLSVLRCAYRGEPACTQVFVDAASGDERTDCPHCAGPLQRGRGQVEFPEDAEPIQHTTRVALTEQGTARDGALFTREALHHRDASGAPRRFHGLVLGDDPWLAESRPLLLGGGRSTSGLVDYQAVPGVAVPPAATGRRLILRLVSPGVLVDAAGRPDDQPDLALLRELLRVDVRIEQHWVRRERLTGWHSAVDLPKSEEHAVTAGSTYVLDLADDPDPADLSRLTEHGIGLRRAEGLGWIELGAWRPPEAPANTDDTSTSGMAPEFAARLEKSGHGRPVLAMLREYHSALRRGAAPPARQILDRPVFAPLKNDLRTMLIGLLATRPSWIPQLAEALEIRLKGGHR
ncbi:CRISPR-associated protein Csx10 [Actinoalloteichus hoggarensis]|nr:hypothetical protein [Actinoalloteichus hoggarensis]MBB5922116.1 CRISPR-associated protein Csx10 [Actinoalloteichus hoggarensis]